MAQLKQLIEKEAGQSDAPDGSTFRSLSLEAVRKISEKTGAPGNQVHVAALKDGIIPLRYHRNIGTLGIDGQVKLLESAAVVVGTGGLGGLASELLARLGLGKITLVDPDTFTESNLNRQLVETESLIGGQKARETARRLREVNSTIEVLARAEMLGPGNASELLADASVVVDGLDSIPARLALQDAASAAGVPFVSAAVAGFVGYVTTIMPGDPGWKALYQSCAIPEAGVEKELGNPAPTPALAASLEVAEVVKLLTSKGAPLRNSFLFFDTMNNTFSVISMKDPNA